MIKWYNLQGEEITAEEANGLIGTDAARVGYEIIGDFEVSTVCLFLDHNHSKIGPPIIYETIVFSHPGRDETYVMKRYCTLKEAQEEHKEIVETIKRMVELKEEDGAVKEDC